MKMPFGKFKGQEVSSLDIDYLRWLRDNVELRDKLAAEVDMFLGMDAEDESARKSSTEGRVLGPLEEILRIVQRLERELLDADKKEGE